MRSRFCNTTVFLAVVVLISASARSQNLIVDGGFEEDNDLPIWYRSSSDFGVSQIDQTHPHGGGSDMELTAFTPSGTTLFFSDAEAESSLAAMSPPAVSNTPYNLSFYLDNAVANGGLLLANVYLLNLTSNTFTEVASYTISSNTSGYQLESLDIPATPIPAQEIDRFVVLYDAQSPRVSNASVTTYLDDVSITAIPEPGCAIGLAVLAIGFSRRGRRA